MRALGYFLCETAKRRQMKALIMGCNFLLVLGFMPFRLRIGKRFPQITISKSSQKAHSSPSNYKSKNLQHLFLIPTLLEGKLFFDTC